MARGAAAHATGPAFPATRVLRRIDEARGRYGLDLSGLTVLTEAATGYYRLTPVVAALAGARRVLAATRESAFGSRTEARAQVDHLASAAGVCSVVEVRDEPARELAASADLVTNLGAVRPLDRAFAGALGSPLAAVSLMFGARDARPADIDVAALRAAGVPVAGVDEAAIDLFRWTGQRIAWWLTEVGLEIAGARIGVWGAGPSALRTASWLQGAGAECARLPRAPRLDELAGLDALVLMDPAARVGESARLRPSSIARVAPGLALLEYAGLVDRPACSRERLVVYPEQPPRAGHVARTIGEILYAPVVELHTAGLRVGELMCRARAEGLTRAAAERRAIEAGPGEAVPTPRREAARAGRTEASGREARPRSGARGADRGRKPSRTGRRLG